MPRRKRVKESGDWLFPKAAIETGSEGQSSLLDVIDNVLNKGAVLNGDLILGVANVDLIYAKLSVLLSALDRVMKEAPPRKKSGRSPRRHHRR